MALNAGYGWGHPHGGRVNDTFTLITAELTVYAVRHGHVAGRDFHVRLTQSSHTVRVEVTGTRTERVPVLTDTEPPGEESGRNWPWRETHTTRPSATVFTPTAGRAWRIGPSVSVADASVVRPARSR